MSIYLLCTIAQLLVFQHLQKCIMLLDVLDRHKMADVGMSTSQFFDVTVCRICCTNYLAAVLVLYGVLASQGW